LNITANDIAGIGTLVLLEGLLSADNALVLALLARRLENKADQSRALTLGIALSFVFRVIGLFVASFVIQLWYLRAAGAAYLLYLAISHFISKASHGKQGGDADETLPAADKSEGEKPIPAGDKRAFQKVVIALALTDLAFAIDSILVAVALTKTLWVIYAGVALGIIALRLVADAFLRLLEKYPALDHTAYGLVAWAGLKLGLEAVHAFGHSVLHQNWPLEMPSQVFWAGMFLITVIGVIIALKNPAKHDVHHAGEVSPEVAEAVAELEEAIDPASAPLPPKKPASTARERRNDSSE
jgi:YkoY family integral membrane protein